MSTKTSSEKRAARARPAATKAATLAVPRAGRTLVDDDGDTRFAEVVALIEAARARGYQAVNTVLVEHYWELGAYISGKIASADAIKERWPKLELERQIRSGAVLREKSATKKVSPAVRQIHPAAIDEFKNAYNIEFLGLAVDHSEADLHDALLRNLGRFLTELGRDFCFVGSQYPVQVGTQDFAIDLVFFHRGLQCLVAFELKVDKFRPADVGQLSFYVEALDRDVKKPHERPAIGVLLCATKDDEVVEYALARTTSPTLVAEYQTFLPPKEVLEKHQDEHMTRRTPIGKAWHG